MLARDFAREVAKRTGVRREDVERIISEAVQLGTEVLQAGDEWRLPGLGVFTRRLTRRRTQPTLPDENGEIERIEVPPKWRIHFRPFNSAKQRINL